MAVEAHYEQLLSRLGSSLETLKLDTTVWPVFAECQSNAADFNILATAIKRRPESLALRLAVKEYQFSQFALACAQYRHAFSGLRLTLELIFASMYYSAHEIDFHLWRAGRRDIKWSVLIDKDTGLFSPDFVAAFSPNLESTAGQYRSIAEKLYRECSEFVHGNPATHKDLPEHLSYDAEAAATWCQKSKSLKLVAVYAFCLCHLSRLDAEDGRNVEPVVLDVLGHVSGIRDHYNQSQAR